MDVFFDEDNWRLATVGSATTFGLLHLLALLVKGTNKRNSDHFIDRMDKESLVSEDLGHIVEMTYWFVKFISDFEKRYGDETKAENRIDFFGDDSAAIIKFARYFIKFIRGFEKLAKIK